MACSASSGQPKSDLDKQAKDAYPFTRGSGAQHPDHGGSETRVYRVSPEWNGTLSNLRDRPSPGMRASEINSIRIVELPESARALRRGPQEAGAGRRSQECREAAPHRVGEPVGHRAKDRAAPKPGTLPEHRHRLRPQERFLPPWRGLHRRSAGGGRQVAARSSAARSNAGPRAGSTGTSR